LCAVAENLLIRVDRPHRTSVVDDLPGRRHRCTVR
jgi:hypothetical protein